MSINFVIATYNGNYKNSTREGDNIQKLNKLAVVLDHLDFYKNKISQITVIISEEFEKSNINMGYENYLQTLKNGEKIKILRKKNDEWLSYSSYYEAYKNYPNFDYYFFCEDDYFYSVDNFDEILINYIKNQNVRILFACINTQCVFEHACHSLCFVDGKILKKIFDDFYKNMKEKNHAHQVAFYMLFKNIDKADLKNSGYICPFFQSSSNNTILYYGSWEKKCILYPVQYFYVKNFNYPNGKNSVEYMLN